MRQIFLAHVLAVLAVLPLRAADAPPAQKQRAFFTAHCTECHDAQTKKGNLDLAALQPAFEDREVFARWVKVLDRIELGEMPPKKKERPPAGETAATLKWLRESLARADAERLARLGLPVQQINTGGACHLDAKMVHHPVHEVVHGPADVLVFENVGNLVCPAEFDLGEDDAEIGRAHV